MIMFYEGKMIKVTEIIQSLNFDIKVNQLNDYDILNTFKSLYIVPCNNTKK